MHRRVHQSRPENGDFRRSTARDTHQRLGDRVGGRRRLLSHIQRGHIGHQCRGRSQVDQAACRLHTPQHTRHQVAARDPLRSRIGRHFDPSMSNQADDKRKTISSLLVFLNFCFTFQNSLDEATDPW